MMMIHASARVSHDERISILPIHYMYRFYLFSTDRGRNVLEKNSNLEIGKIVCRIRTFCEVNLSFRRMRMRFLIYEIAEEIETDCRPEMNGNER